MRRASSLILFLLLFSSNFPAVGQCNNWDNLVAYPDASIDDLDRDRFGNLYAIGGFYLHDLIIGSTTIPLHGDRSMFVLKFDKHLTLQWAKSIGNYAFGESIVIDNEDNVVIAGYFYDSTISFDTIQLTNSGRSEMFVAKFCNEGSVIWALGSSGLNDGFNSNLAITASNNIIVTSAFVAGNVSFAGHPIRGFGGYDSFVALLDPSGNSEWIRSFGGTGSPNPDYILGVEADSKENIIVTGFFESPRIAFDSFIIDAFTVSENYFVAKLNSDGNTLWAKGAQAPVNNSGSDVAVDKNDNIFVAGHFIGGNTKFDTFVLTDLGAGDAFIVEYDRNGTTLQARNFGGTGTDSAQKLAIDNDGNVVVGGSYYSNTFTIDSFTETKSEFPSDAFIVTLNDHLVAKCLKHVSGDAHNFVGALHVDHANNIWLMVRSLMASGTTQFDGVYAVNGDISSMVVSIGANNNVDSTTTAGPFKIDLGGNIVKCYQDQAKLDGGSWCGAVFTWSDGSHGRFLLVQQPGLYWVEGTLNASIERDSIVVTDIPKLDVILGEDEEVCSPWNINMQFDVSQPAALGATYFWDNGSALPTRDIHAPGHYWVKVNDVCETVYDSVSVDVKIPLRFDLGNDSTICSGGSLVIGTEIPGALTYEWRDGSTSPQLTVATSDTYELTVFDGCEVVKDSIAITFLNVSELVMPNVVTANDDNKNDSFIVPQELKENTLTIINRWGELIYSASNYQTGWSGESNPPGIYYYSLEGKCLQGYKGYIQLIK